MQSSPASFRLGRKRKAPAAEEREIQKRIELVKIDITPDCKKMKPGRSVMTANIGVREDVISVPEVIRAAQESFVNGGVIPPDEEIFLVDKNVSKLYDEPGTRSKVLIELRSLPIRML